MVQHYVWMKFFRRNHLFFFSVSFSFFVVLLALPVWGAVFDDLLEEEEEEEFSAWSATLETALIFDDNVFQEKKLKKSDTILESVFFLAYERGELFLSALSIIDRYRDNGILDYNYYEIGIEGALGPRNTVGLFFNLSPTASLDKADAGMPFELASRGFNLLLDREVDWGSVGFSFALTRLNYSASFEAKDSEIIAVGPTFFYSPSVSWSIFGDATFERGRAAGGLIGVRPDDISYRATVFSLQSRYYFSPKMNLRLKYSNRSKRFTTTVDNIHAGRLDRTQLLGLYAEIRPFPSFTLRVGFEETWLISTDTTLEFRARRGLFSAAYSF